MKWTDITRPVEPSLAGWPGDTPVGYDLAWSRAAGSTVNVGRLTISLHTGTHCDAPFHFTDDGQTSDQIDPLALCGPACVVDARGVSQIGKELLPPDIPSDCRVLFRTDVWLNSSQFPAQIPVLTDDAVERLAQLGTKVAGFDLPSVDPLDSQELSIHHALANHGIVILEGLDLQTVQPGFYDMLALPMRIMGADGTPVRALLRPIVSPDSRRTGVL